MRIRLRQSRTWTEEAPAEVRPVAPAPPQTDKPGTLGSRIVTVDAGRLAVRDMEGASIDIVSDGEQRRESYFNQFANALDGLDLERPGMAPSRFGRKAVVPRVVGPIRRAHPVCLSEMQFLRTVTE